MSELFGMIRALTKKPTKPETPFSTIRAARNWLENVPRTSDYDAHHAIVEGLERFNADTRGDVVNRLKVLRVMEETGLPFQDKIIDQYFRNQETFRLAKQSLWRESQMFWNQLANSWLFLFKQSLRGSEQEKLQPWLTEITLKSLRYTALCMRWEYYGGHAASGLSWRRLHKIYRMAEIAGIALSPIQVAGRETHCAREYAQALILELANPPGFKPREVQAMTEILEALPVIPVPEIRSRKGAHSHCVDMSAPAGAERLGERWIHGKRLRYLELEPMLIALDQRAQSCGDEQEALLCRQFVRVLNRGGIRRDGARTPRAGHVWAAAGLQSVMGALSKDLENHKTLSLTEWRLRDESRDGLGFVLPEGENLPIGRLAVVSYQPGDDSWHLIAVRWVRQESGQTLVGAQCLSRHPKLVSFEFVESGPGSSNGGTAAVFVPLADISQGMASHLLLPRTAYVEGQEVRLHDNQAAYRIRLGTVVETHEEDWVRVDFAVLARETPLEMAA